MNKLRLYTVLASSLMAASIGNAQAQSFDGFFGQVGIGFESISPSFSNSGVNVTGYGYFPYNTSIDSSNGFTGTVTAGYMIPVTKDFLFGIGAEYSPLESQSSNYTVGITGLGTAQGSYKKENSYNFFVSPATPIGKDGLLYGKVGYTGHLLNPHLDLARAVRAIQAIHLAWDTSNLLQVAYMVLPKATTLIMAIKPIPIMEPS